MGYGVAVTVVVALVTLAASSAHGEPPPKCWFAGEPAVTAAQVERLERLSLEINSLGDYADCRPLRERLRQLLAEPCFRKLEMVASLVECGSGLALRDWWNQGGLNWVRSAMAGEYRGKHLQLPPGIRSALSLDANPGHALAPLLCRVGDATCGRETAGWLKRADDAEASDHYTTLVGPRGPGPGKPCLKVQGKSAVDRHAAWRDCIEQQRQRQYARMHLPTGAFRAPAQGWLVVRGRRGHYTFSDELAAYDLATGAAYRAQQAGDLGLGGGPEDLAAAERRKTGRRPVTVTRGRVPIDNLREAALILFLWPERQLQLAELGVELPAGVQLLPLPAGFRFTEAPKVIISSSADTALSWEWIQNGRVVLAGGAVYTGLGRSRGYPTWLLELAEEGLTPGCPPVPLPPRILGLGRPIGGVAFIDAKPEELDASEVALARALSEPAAACAKRAGAAE